MISYIFIKKIKNIKMRIENIRKKNMKAGPGPLLGADFDSGTP